MYSVLPSWYDCALVTDSRSTCDCASPDPGAVSERVATVFWTGSTTNTVLFCWLGGKLLLSLLKPCKPLIRPARMSQRPPKVPATYDCTPLGNEKSACSILIRNGRLSWGRMGLTSGVWFCAQTVEMPPSNIATPMPVNRKVQFFMRISQGVCRTTVIALARARYHATLARCNESARAATSERQGHASVARDSPR